MLRGSLLSKDLRHRSASGLRKSTPNGKVEWCDGLAPRRGFYLVLMLYSLVPVRTIMERFPTIDP